MSNRSNRKVLYTMYIELIKIQLNVILHRFYNFLLKKDLGCLNLTCLNGGICIPNLNGTGNITVNTKFVCQCPPGFTGLNCQLCNQYFNQILLIS